MYKKEFLDKLSKATQKYEEEVNQILDELPGAEKERITSSGIPVKPLYTPLDVKDMDYFKDLSFPGEHPFTRGVYPGGYRSRKTNIRQITGLGTAEETNERWKWLISQGVTALAVIGVQPWGYDADDERAIGFTGKDEIVCDSLYDYETLFDGIDIGKFSVHLIAGSAFTLANYFAMAEKKGIPLKELKGSMSNTLKPSKQCLDIIEFCMKNVPNFNAGYLDVRNTREGGCTAAQEVGWGMAMTKTVVDVLVARGIDVDDFASRITWFVNSGPDFFEEIAKFRCIRRMWSRMFRDDYGAKNPRTLQARMHCQTYAPQMTRAQPFNNMIRSAYYGLAAILGGVQSMHINSFDEPFATPTELSASLSVKTQQIINFETGITSVVDPLGGSYYVESLTDQLEEKAQEIIDDIESKGGSFKAFESMRNQLRKEAIQLQDSIDSGKMVIVGTNEFVDDVDIQLKALEILQNSADFEAIKEYDPAIRDKQIARLEKVRKERDNDKLEKAMKRLSDALNADDENMMPATIEAVKCYMTQGEYARVVAGANKQITKTDEEEFLG